MEDPVASPSKARGDTPTKSRLTDFAMAAFRRVSDSPAVLAAAAAAHLPLSGSPRNSVQLPPKSGANWSTNSAFESGHETEETASSVLKNNLTDETSSNEHDSVDDARKSPPAAAQQQQQLAQARGAQAFASVSSPTGLRGRSQAAHGASPVKEAAAGCSSPSGSVTPRSRQQQQGGAASPARSGSLFKKLSAAHRLFTASGPESGEEGQEDPETTHVIPFHQEFGSAQQQQRQSLDASPALYTLHGPEEAAAAWEQEIKRMMTAGNMLFEALERPAPSVGLVRCCVRRIKTFFGRNSVFELHMERSEQLLLAARKRKKSKVSAYVISSDADDLKRDGDSCIAKLKANFVGTEYVLWGKSDDPAVRKGFASEQLCLSFKPSGIEGGPHTMHAALPVPDSTSAAFASSSGAWRQAAAVAAAADGAKEAAEGGARGGGTGSMLGELLEQAKGGKTLASDVERGLALLCSKPPEYDEAIKAYLLDFGGRVKQYSVKNFQLVCWDHTLDRKGSQVVLQFGKVSEDVYALDFAYPLSIQTAFGAALAKLDTKLCYMLG